MNTKRNPLAQVEAAIVYQGHSYPVTIDVYGTIGLGVENEKVLDATFELNGERVDTLPEKLLQQITDDILGGVYD